MNGCHVSVVHYWWCTWNGWSFILSWHSLWRANVLEFFLNLIWHETDCFLETASVKFLVSLCKVLSWCISITSPRKNACFVYLYVWVLWICVTRSFAESFDCSGGSFVEVLLLWHSPRSEWLYSLCKISHERCRNGDMQQRRMMDWGLEPRYSS